MPEDQIPLPLTLHAMASSGNCYKVELLLAQLALPFSLIEINILRGESRTAAFLARNPNGRVPVLELGDGRYLAESNAILVYLADHPASPMLPADRFARAKIFEWLFFEQYSHEPFIATNRYWLHLLKQPERHQAQIDANHPRGVAALQVMETALAEQPFLTGDRYSIADIALYAYTHVAPEGGYDLAALPNVQRWLAAVAAAPGYQPMRR